MLSEFHATVLSTLTALARALGATLAIGLVMACGQAAAATMAPAAATSTAPATARDTAATIPATSTGAGMQASAVAPPTISGTPATSAQTGVAYAFTPTASSPRGGALTFSIKNRPNWCVFSTSNGTLSGTPRTTQAGRYGSIIIAVSDGTARASLASFAITVASTGTTAPPTISGTPTTSVQVGTAYSFTPTASSPRGGKLTFAIVNKPSWATFTTTTGQLSGTPAAADVGAYANVWISMNDGTASASLAPFLLTVTATTAPPTISGTPTTSVQATTAYSFTPSAASPRKAAMTFSITTKPSWATFSATTGQLSGTPLNANAGTYSGIVIAVSDGTASASLAAFNITVTSAPPTISGTPATSVNAGSAYSFKPIATSPSGGALTFAIANTPSWATFSTTTGQLSGTPTTSNEGTFSNITISVSDGISSASLFGFAITVAAGTTGSATLDWTPTTTQTDGSALTNLAGYRIRYGNTAGSYPNLVTLSNPGLSSYVITGLASGTWYFIATAFDSAGIESDSTNAVSKTIP